MPDSFAPSFPEPEPPKLSGKRRLGTVLFLLMLGLGALFGYRVFRYYRQIQKGVLDPSVYSFQSTQASPARLASIAQAAPGNGELATPDDPSRGPADAPLTIVEFADFGCPFSAQESYVVSAIGTQYAQNVRIVYRDFPLPDLHPGSDLAAQAAECAQDQNKFWEYHDLLYRNSGDFTEDTLLDYATQVGLNMGQFRNCLESGQYVSEVADDLSAGVAAGVSGTPTFFFNGEKVDGAIPFGSFTQIVDAFLKQD